MRKPLFAALGLLCVVSVLFWRSLPQPLFNSPFATILLARDGSLLGARIAADEQWRFPALTSVPQKFSVALLSYEDKRFYQHPGVDPLAIARAIKLNLQQGRVVSGGSTLTMQLARLALQQQAGRARGWGRKLREALLALRLECSYAKTEILALYASYAPFGGNVVGLEAAAWRYFGRAPEQLSWAEVATLAVLPNAPALVTPGRNRALLLRKRNQLLQRLHTAGTLSALDLQAALAEPLVAQPLALPELAPHLLDTLHTRYPQQHRFMSTLDVGLQHYATDSVRTHMQLLAQQGVSNAAALILDHQSGAVLAYVGNTYWLHRVAEFEQAYAVDIVQRPRSTGSTLKPLLYAAMLDSGQLLPRMLLTDIPTQYKGFAPENFDHTYRGAVPADQALSQSLNIPAVRLLREYGVERFYDLLQGLQLSTLTEPPSHYGLALILGGAEATLWDIASLHANLAYLASQNQDLSPLKYHPIQVLQDEKVATLPRAEISPAAAWITLTALLQVTRPEAEAHWQQFAFSRKIAWKTGTSWGQRDAWAVGSSGQYTVAVWVGNANGTGQPGLTGSTAAAPLMFTLHNRLPNVPWLPQPVRGMKRVRVCVDDGYLASDDCVARDEWVPLRSHFDRLTPFHQRIHLDQTGRYRVDAQCARVANMRHAVWFVLPPTQEYFYRHTHAHYKLLPPYRADCTATLQQQTMMEFIYPSAAGKLYLPVDLNGQQQRTVFEVVHRDPEAVLYWHLDGTYIGATQTFHQQSFQLQPGQHIINVVDSIGHRITRAVEVLAKAAPEQLD